ncbi:LytR/AlgR family response regulator transcription factor [Gelidibacter salicanalis]|uniref:Response regulator transcription factor n=1 Tax=Gelidibacter salicanalis TaxID=291193 RepID=A0A934NDT2_9FLAO|nr:LytTR family DNA-binding domain-containing protein [Gelidibacter salicanalis]MBJ7882015.1 response regulator transcription factor [Gelidibacter salicanalis]
MIGAVIIDDEVENIKLIERLMKKECSTVNILGVSNTKSGAVELINKVRPNLIFMDVNLDAFYTGFDVLEQIEPLDAKVIFVTSYDEFAIKAFGYNTIAYIVKPINKTDLVMAVNKTITELEHKIYTKEAQLVSLRESINYDMRQIIAVTTINDIELIKVDNIIYLSSDSRYTHFYLKDGKHIISSRNLGKYESLISGNFFRIHAKYYVNVNYLHKIHKEMGSWYCEMETGELLTISQRKYADFLKFLRLK